MLAICLQKSYKLNRNCRICGIFIQDIVVNTSKRNKIMPRLSRRSDVFATLPSEKSNYYKKNIKGVINHGYRLFIITSKPQRGNGRDV